MTNENLKEFIPGNFKVDLYGNVAVFEVPATKIVETANFLYHEKQLQLKLITATDEQSTTGCLKIWYIFGVPGNNTFVTLCLKLIGTCHFPSVSSTIWSAINYERRIKTFFGLKPVGNPDPRSIVLHENWPENLFPLQKDFDWNNRPPKAHGTYKFEKIDEEGIYEIPVGPIHAGIIEPGHFRFSVMGEKIMLLEPKLGFKHKGSEKLFETLSLENKLRLSEKISGDSSFSHSLAYCQALEKLSDVQVSARANYLRSIFAELERLANHFGDIGAIMLDTGFNFGGANGARLREMVMQINERLTESRFLRGVNLIGGVSKDISEDEKIRLSKDLDLILKDFSEVINIAKNSISLLDRLEGTGTLSSELANKGGAIGVSAKAVGIAIDARAQYPYAAYEDLFNSADIAVESKGDVRARYFVRIKEVIKSVAIIQKALSHLPSGPIHSGTDNFNFKKDSISVSIVEGWRGDIVYFITTDSGGKISRVVPRDPSFVNWGVVGDVGFGNVVPDFPLINKSFNLSYTGNDL